MKKLQVLLLFYSLLQLTNVHAQFVEPECGIISNPNYTYTNYSDFSGMGFTLYHNGEIISQMYGTQPGRGYNVVLLKFINDTTGYFIYSSKFHSITTKYIVNKIEGNNIKYLYDGYNILLFYIVNEHLAYMLSAGSTVFLARCSDIQPLKQIINPFPESDTTIVDTLIGTPLCPDFQELNVQFNSANLKLVFRPNDTLTSVFKNDTKQLEIFPNPAGNFFSIKTDNALGSCMINVFDMNGVLQKSIQPENIVKPTIFVGDLSAGIYWVEMTEGRKKYYSKLIKK